MAVPTFQDLMLPVLQNAADGHEHAFKESLREVADCMSISEADRQELLPSGVQTRLYNRFTWAVMYMRKAALLEATGHGRYRITQRGLDTLATNPSRIDHKYLMRFEEYVEFKSPQHKTVLDKASNAGEESDEPATPEERLQSGFEELRTALRNEILESILACSPEFFEKLVVQLLVRMGYGGSIRDAGQAVGKSGDGGIDGVIKEDKLGLDRIYLQAKRWNGSVGSPEIQKFAGALEGANSQKGVFLTTSTFTASARDYVKHLQKRIILLDGNEIADLMIGHGIGVTETERYVVCRLDSDFFDNGI